MNWGVTDTLLATAGLIAVGAFVSGRLFRRSWKHATLSSIAAPLVLVPLGLCAGMVVTLGLSLFGQKGVPASDLGLVATVATSVSLFALFVSVERATYSLPKKHALT